MVNKNEKLRETLVGVNQSFKIVNKAFERYGRESSVITEQTKRLDDALALIAKGPGAHAEGMETYTTALLDANDATMLLRMETQQIQTEMAAFMAAMKGFTN